MKTYLPNKGSKGGFTLIELMVVVAILSAIAAISYGPILEHMNDGAREQAKQNLKNIFNTLNQFKMDYGAYPCDETADRLVEESPDLDFGELKGTNSNAYFRQLFYLSNFTSEKPFFAELGTKNSQPDDKIAGGKALRPGENAMSYVMTINPQDEQIKESVSISNAPLAMCALVPSKTPYIGDKLLIDMKSFREHFFVLCCDGSVTDRKNDIVDENEDSVGEMRKGKSIFPESRRGRSTAQNHVVLTQEK